MSRPNDQRSYIASASSKSMIISASKRTFPEKKRSGRNGRDDIPDTILENKESRRRRSSPRREVDRIREAHIEPPMPVSRPGDIFLNDNCFDFLTRYLEFCNKEADKKGCNAPVKRLRDVISDATEAEHSLFRMKPHQRLVHCDMIIEGLPPSVFFGAGFGDRPASARLAAAKDIMDKCLRIGIFSRDLYEFIMAEPTFSKKVRVPMFSHALKAMLTLDRLMSMSAWPWDVLTARDQHVEVLEKIKHVFSQVKSEVYGREGSPNRTHSSRRMNDNDHQRPSNHDPPSFSRDSRPVDRRHNNRSFDDPKKTEMALQREELLRRERVLQSIEPLEMDPTPSSQAAPPFPLMAPPMPFYPMATPYMNPGFMMQAASGYASSASALEEERRRMQVEEDVRRRQAEEERMRQQMEEERLRRREEELERKMEAELTLKKLQMEEEIRRQVEEEARVRQRLMDPYRQMSSIPSHYSSSSTLAAIPPVVDYEMEEINRLVKETEEKLISLKHSAQQSTLDTIFNSRVFQTVSQLGEQANMLTKQQKQSLLRDLKQLLSEAMPQATSFSSQALSLGSHGDMGSHRLALDTSSSSRDRGHRRSRSRSPSARDYYRDSRDRSRSPRHRSGGYRRSPSPLRKSKPDIVQFGNISLRSLTEMEQKRLVTGDVVIAQDAKTLRWTTAKIIALKDNRATLAVGSGGTWKKSLSELYKETSVGLSY